MQRFARHVWVLTAMAFSSPGFIGAQTALHVDARAEPGGDGSSWESAFDDLQAAIEASEALLDPVEIWIAGGTYVPSRPQLQGEARSVTFELGGGVSLLGGFEGTEEAPAQRDPRAPRTIFSGDLLGDDQPDFGLRGDNAYHVLTIHGSSSPVLIERITLTGGNAGGSLPAGIGPKGGGAIVLSGAVGPVFRNVRFIENEADTGGGLSTPLSCQLESCLFQKNRATGSSGQGGAIRVEAVSQAVSAVNTVFVGNEAWSGGVVSTVYAGFVAANCTFVGNHAQNLIGGVLVEGPSGFLALNNCILWGNGDSSGSGEGAQVWAPFLGSPSAFVESSCVQGWTGSIGGSGNTGANPLFADELGADGIPASGDESFRLVPDSPCVDAGRNAIQVHLFWPQLDELPLLDGCGRVRIADGNRDGSSIVDMGAYERQPRAVRAPAIPGTVIVR